MPKLWTILILAPTLLFGQRIVRGTVVDDRTGEPLPFVYVTLAGDPTRGVLTNEHGMYQFDLSQNMLQDELVFSLLSYQEVRQPLWRLPPEQEVLNVRMESSFIDLGPVVVISDLGLRALVERTVAAAPRNYGHEDYLLKAYLRKYDIDDEEYTQVLEAMLSIREGTYQEEPVLAKVWIDEFRGTPYSGPDFNFFWSKINHQGNLIGPYEGPGNFARAGRYAQTSTPFFESPEALRAFAGNDGDKRFWRHLTFSNRGEYLSGGDTLVRIHYQADATLPGASQTTSEANWNRGELLINKNDLAVVRYRHGDLERGGYREVTYEKVNGRYYPRMMRHVLQYRYAGETRKHFSSRYLYVTDIITNPQRIRKSRKGKRLQREQPTAAITVPYRVDFWEDNEMLRRIPAPRTLAFERDRLETFEQSFRDNARRIKE